MTIEQCIWNNATLTPDKVAITSGKNSATYKQLCERILAAKKKLEQEGLQKNDRIVLAAGKQIEFAYIYFGAHLAGYEIIPIDSATEPTRLEYIVKTTNAKLLIGFDQSELQISKLSLKDFKDLEGESFSTPSFRTDNEVADILFTTGTTGEPKGVPLTYENEMAAASNINTFIKNTKEDVELLALPISHSFGLGRLRCCLVNGQTIILLGNFANVKKLFRIMSEQHVTGFTMVPASWRYLQKFTGDKLGEFADQLHYIEMGSAYFSAEEKKKLADLLPHTRVCMHYGLTEASRSAFMEFHDDGEHLGSVGKPSPNTDIKIFDEQGTELKPNEEGEICVKGAHVTHGYLNHPIEASFFGDYFRTGDWGYKTPEGYIYLKSRKKDLINVGGKKLSPVETETELLKIPGVEDCACIGIPDKNGVLGEVVKAFIVKAEGSDLSEDNVKNQLSGKLEGYKIPAEVEWIDKIPRTQNGKIQRALLKK
jgi:long-chain acyl-CoA synthetase